MNLCEYLLVTFKDGLSYPDAVQLCLGLYVSADLISSVVPAEFFTKEGISQALADFARHGGVSDVGLPSDTVSAAAVTEEQHWLGVIERIFMTADNIVNMSRVRELLSHSVTDDNRDDPK